jgi:MFS family permease
LWRARAPRHSAGMTSTGSTDMPGRRVRPPWAGRNYTLLTAAAVLTGLGGQGALIASAFAVIESGGGAAEVGLVAAGRTVPLIVFLLIGGAVADRLPRHRVMVAANALGCVSQGLFAVLVLSGDARLWHMVLLSALGGTAQAFFAPAAEGMLLSSVDGASAGRAFAFFRLAVNGSAIGGAALGGALVSVLGPGWVLAVDAAAFAAAGALRALLDVSALPARAPGGGLAADLRDGWREVRGRPWLWGIVAQFSVVVAAAGAAEAVYGPLVARDELGGPRPWGIALAWYGAGTLAGTLVMLRRRPRRLLLVGTLGVFPLAAIPAALAVPLPLGPLSAAMFLAGAGIQVFGVAWMTALHQEIPEEKLSRVSAYDWLGSVALLPVATAAAGPAERLVGRTTALVACAVLIIAVTAAVLLLPDVRNLTLRTTPRAGAAVPGQAAAAEPGPGVERGTGVSGAGNPGGGAGPKDAGSGPG